MKKSFSLIELVIVIVVIGILYSSVNFSLNDSSLNQAAHQLVSHINYTRHLALKDNKMQYYPISSGVEEMNRSKYWFKQWWQIKFRYFTKDGVKNYFYEIFTDLPYDGSHNFNKVGNLPNNETSWNLSYAKNPLNHKYLVGKNKENSSDKNFPATSDDKLNLTNTYGIVDIVYTNFSSSRTLIFDNYGNCYLSEGDKGDAGDINPYDKDKRVPLLKTAKITLCQDDNCEKNISVCVSPKIGNAYVCN